MEGMVPGTPFSMLVRVFGDPRMLSIFSEESTIESWLKVEAALAKAQADTGDIDAQDAAAIRSVCKLDVIDRDRLWRETATVGYPIFPLVHQLAEALPDGPNGRVHFGATTQDIMDSGLALQLSAAIDRNVELLEEVGDALVEVMRRDGDAVLAARTHAQQAVPTTLGAKLAVFLEQFRAVLADAGRVRSRACRVSLFGAGGTSAALGTNAVDVRRNVAEALGLKTVDVPWHVDRGGIVVFAQWCDAIATVAMRLAREIIDLSRTEIGELAEPGGHLRGSSSTMPQKSNPIASETIMGFGINSHAALGAAIRSEETGHERSAGEWQAEWIAIPQIAVAAASALNTLAPVVVDLVVDRERMANNLDITGGQVLAEAYMIDLAVAVGRENAHDAVYEAARRAREDGISLQDALIESLPEGSVPDVSAENYIGEAFAIADRAIDAWIHTRKDET